MPAAWNTPGFLSAAVVVVKVSESSDELAFFVVAAVSILLRGWCIGPASCSTEDESGPSIDLSNSRVGLPPNMESCKLVK